MLPTSAQSSRPTPRTRHLWLLALGSAVVWSPVSVAQALHPPAQPATAVLTKLLFLVVWLGPALVYGRGFLHLGIAESIGLVPLARGRASLIAAAGSLAFLAALIGLARVSGEPLPKLPSAGEIALTLFLAWAEEAPLRGFFLLQGARAARFRSANFWVSALFAAVHVPVFLARGGGFEIVPMCIVLFILSLVLGWTTRITGTIWVATLLHAANNLLAIG